MILKVADDRSADLATLGALRERADLTSSQLDAINQQLQALQTGDRGEREVAHFLDHGLRDSADTLVIHDLRLKVNGQTAQIDHLVISRYRLAYVLETKTLNASLQCNEAGEWTAWYGAHRRGTPVPIASPIEQARRHVDVLGRWFKANKWTTIKRIDPVVVVTPTTFVGKTRAKGDEAVAIVRSDLFARWWENDRDIGHPLTTPWLFASRFSTDQLTQLGAMLVADHRPVKRNWEAKFGLSQIPGFGARKSAGCVSTPRSKRPTSPEAVSSSIGVQSSQLVDAPFDGREIATPLGRVRLKRVADGRYALRHAVDKQLGQHVGRVGRRHGTWQPRFENWLVPHDVIGIVAAELSAPTA